VQSVRLNAGCSQVLSCGADHHLVATDVDTSLMDMFAEGFAALQKAAGRSTGGCTRLLQALEWHLEQGIVQVGRRAAWHLAVPHASGRAVLVYEPDFAWRPWPTRCPRRSRRCCRRCCWPRRARATACC
jgi:hypothetical protein